MKPFSKYFENFEFFFQNHTLSKVTANAGLMVNAMTSDESNVTVIMKGIENMNLPIIHVMKSIAENIQTTVSVVEIKTFL